MQAAGETGIVLRHNTAGAETGSGISRQRIFLSVKGRDKDTPALVFSTSDTSSVRSILESEKILKAGYGLKRYIQELRRDGIDLKGSLADLELMHYLVNPETSHRLDTLVQSYLGLDLTACHSQAAEDNTGLPEPDLFSGPTAAGPEDEAAMDYSDAVDASLMLPLHSLLLDEFSKDPSIERYTKR